MFNNRYCCFKVVNNESKERRLLLPVAEMRRYQSTDSNESKLNRLHDLLEEKLHPRSCSGKLINCIATINPYLQMITAGLFYLGIALALMFFFINDAQNLKAAAIDSFHDWNTLLSVQNSTCAVTYNNITQCETYPDSEGLNQGCIIGNISAIIDPLCYQALSSLCCYCICDYTILANNMNVQDCDGKLIHQTNGAWTRVDVSLAMPESCTKERRGSSIGTIVAMSILFLGSIVITSQGKCFNSLVATCFSRVPSRKSIRDNFLLEQKELLNETGVLLQNDMSLEDILQKTKERAGRSL